MAEDTEAAAVPAVEAGAEVDAPTAAPVAEGTTEAAAAPAEAEAAEPAPAVLDGPIETVAETGAVAGDPVELAPEPEREMPAEISGEIAPERHAQTEGRVEAWLSDTRYFLSTLTHEVVGEAGEIIAYLKARL